MPKNYIYTVTNRRTGKIVAEGNLADCASATGLSRNTIYDMATGTHDKYRTDGRKTYNITRRISEKKPGKYKYYAVYEKGTDKILACGTAAECAKMMGWKNIQILYQALSRERRDGNTPYEFYMEDVDYEEELDA